MESILIYLAKSVISLSVFYLIYWFLLRKGTHFLVNRVYLIISSFAAFTIPLLTVRLSAPELGGSSNIILETITIGSQNIDIALKNNNQLSTILISVYLTGVAIFSVRFLYNLIKIRSLIKKYEISSEEGFYLVYTDAKVAPFSFFNWVFICPGINTDDTNKILNHELVHVKQKHSMDIILMELILILQWMNPVAWLYRHAVTEVHEFLADEGVLKQKIEKKRYQELLLSMAMGVCASDLSNNFNYSLLKKRFVMMTKEKSGKYASLKALIAVPVITATWLLLSCTQSGANQNLQKSDSALQQEKTTLAQQTNNQGTLSENPDKEKFEELTKQPEFKGGYDAMVQYLVKSVKYPEKAKIAGIQGKVFVSFVVKSNGKITDVTISKSVNEEIDKEAVRVVSSMPDWTPGENKSGKKVDAQMTLPIQFKLDDDKHKK